jgi:DNA helicase HerA-like ATPase
VPYESSEYLIVIEYEDFLTRFDLDEILSSIDSIIEDELLSNLDPNFRRWRRRHHYLFPHEYRDVPELSYVGITAADRGSMVLTVLVSAAIAAYVARRFRSGADQGVLAGPLERAGKLPYLPFAPALARINDWAAQYVPRQREMGGKVKMLRAIPKRKSEPQEPPPRAAPFKPLIEP